jgi:hypothetical protein
MSYWSEPNWPFIKCLCECYCMGYWPVNGLLSFFFLIATIFVTNEITRWRYMFLKCTNVCYIQIV